MLIYLADAGGRIRRPATRHEWAAPVVPLHRADPVAKLCAYWLRLWFWWLP